MQYFLKYKVFLNIPISSDINPSLLESLGDQVSVGQLCKETET